MSASDWYARRLGQQAQPRQEPPRVNPNSPGRPPQYPQQYAQPVYQQQPVAQPVQYTQPGQVVQFAGYQYANAEQYQGGIGQKLNPDLCPQCGGNQYFAKVRTKGRGPDPAGHCYNCGYNELFDQGDVTSWGGGSNAVVTAGDVELASIQVNASPWSGNIAPAE